MEQKGLWPKVEILMVQKGGTFWDQIVVPLFVPCNIFYHIAECSLSSIEVGMVTKPHYNLVDLYVQFIFVFIH